MHAQRTMLCDWLTLIPALDDLPSAQCEIKGSSAVHRAVELAAISVQGALCNRRGGVVNFRTTRGMLLTV